MNGNQLGKKYSREWHTHSRLTTLKWGYVTQERDNFTCLCVGKGINWATSSAHLFLNPFLPRPVKTFPFIIFFYLKPDNFTHQGKASGREKVKTKRLLLHAVCLFFGNISAFSINLLYMDKILVYIYDTVHVTNFSAGYFH